VTPWLLCAWPFSLSLGDELTVVQGSKR